MAYGNSQSWKPPSWMPLSFKRTNNKGLKAAVDVASSRKH
jgi:hypothetical protein